MVLEDEVTTWPLRCRRITGRSRRTLSGGGGAVDGVTGVKSGLGQVNPMPWAAPVMNQTVLSVMNEDAFRGVQSPRESERSGLSSPCLWG